MVGNTALSNQGLRLAGTTAAGENLIGRDSNGALVVRLSERVDRVLDR